MNERDEGERGRWRERERERKRVTLSQREVEREIDGVREIDGGGEGDRL